MRIIAGEAKGKTLKSRDGKGTRPTDARSREMLFNILGARVIDAAFLDLYAGTGAIGLEALSRGAEFCVFIEQNAVACRVIKENVRALGFGSRAQVWNNTVQSALRRLCADSKYFDVVFADPPFANPHELKNLSAHMNGSAALLQNINASQPADKAMDKSGALLHNVAGQNATLVATQSSSGLLVIQHHRKAQPVLEVPWKLQQERRAGESTLSFFQIAELDASTNVAPKLNEI